MPIADTCRKVGTRPGDLHHPRDIKAVDPRLIFVERRRDDPVIAVYL